MKYIKKGKVYDFVKPWLGDGLLNSNGSKWQQRRKILTPTFHFNILKRFIEIFGEHSEQLVNELKKECQNSQTNIIPIITHKTLASICETAMGTKLNLNKKSHTNYLNAIHDVAPTMVDRALSPHLYTNIIFNISPLGLKQNRSVKILHNFTKSVIEEREKQFDDKEVVEMINSKDQDNDDGVKKKRLAMLDLLLSAKKHGNQIDDEGIRDEVETFMFEGHDTTAISICMTLLLLAHHKEVQEKIIAELDNIFGDDKRAPSYDDVQKMKYLELCIKESLRLYPSVPLIVRRLEEDVPLTKHVAPTKCEVFVHIYNVHRQSDIFPDPEKFIPERFLPENAKGRHPYSYIPFSAGPRNCIGQKYALLELKIIISSILRNFTLEPISKFEELRWVVDLILRVNGPINIKFNLRK